MKFLYEMSQRVKLVESSETGKIIGRAEYVDMLPQYLVRYRAGDGCQRENWFSEAAIEAS